MKHNNHHDNAAQAGPKLTPIRFEYIHPTATSVCVAGTFNRWQPESKTLHSTGGGLWFKDTILAPGKYEYCFIVDGRWIPDPKARETVPNPFGGRNSVLKVAEAAETGQLNWPGKSAIPKTKTTRNEKI